MTGAARMQLGGFLYLQLLDLMTTLTFLVMGVSEGNPMVRFAMSMTPHPLAGLIGVKLLAVSLAYYCFTTGRITLLSRANLFYAVGVAWNVYVILAAGTRMLQ